MSLMGDADLVSLKLPDPEKATGYRAFLTDQAQLRVVDFAPGSVGIEPAEGAGAIREFFNAYRLWDPQNGCGADGWRPLEENLGYASRTVDRAGLTQIADELLKRDDLASHLYALQALVAATPPAELAGILDKQIESIFADAPEGALWLVTTDQVWLARLTVLRSRVTLDLTPDLPLDPESFAGLRALEGHSLTSSIDVTGALNPLLLTFSPGVFGYALSWAPHALVLLFGELKELRVEPPGALSRLYEPNVLENYPQEPRSGLELSEGLTAPEAEGLLPWWVSRLNVLYSHACDPTRFATELGAYDAPRQYAWLLTFERMLADALLVLAQPQGSALVRQQAAFDVLDKAEALLGTRRGDSGGGFKRLLRRSDALPRLRRSFANLPGAFPERFGAYAELLYDRTYDTIRGEVLPHRLTDRGVRVARRDADAVEAEDMDTYVSNTLRAIRNSSHGFLDTLADRPDRFRLATHTGNVPYPFANLAALIGLSLVADAKRLLAGQWWDA